MSQFPPIYTFHGDGSMTLMTNRPAWIANVIKEVYKTGEIEDAMENVGGCKITEAYGVTNETLTVWRRKEEEWLVEYHDFDRAIIAIYISGEVNFWVFQTTQLPALAMKIMTADTYHRDLRAATGLDSDEPEADADESDIENHDGSTGAPLSKLKRPNKMN